MSDIYQEATRPQGGLGLAGAATGLKGERDASVLQNAKAWVDSANTRLIQICCDLNSAADRAEGPVPREQPEAKEHGLQAMPSDFCSAMEVERRRMMDTLNELECIVNRFNRIA